MGRKHALRVAGALAALGTVAACSSGHPAPKVTRTVTVLASPSGPSGPSTPPTSSGAAPSTPPPAHLSRLPGRCGGLLPKLTVANAINRDINGQTAYVVGVPEKDIKRIGYLNCRYGVTSQHSPPTVEIGVSLYQTAAAAQARIKPTVDDYVNHGATATDTTVAGHPAHILTGGNGAGYTAATIVLADGQRTIAVSVADPIPAGKQTSALKALAALADRRTAG